MAETGEDVKQIAFSLYLQGFSLRKISEILKQRCNASVSYVTLSRWAKKYNWGLRRKQKELLDVKIENEGEQVLAEAIEIEVDKADKLDYQDLCQLQERYKKYALERYAPRAVEIVIQCIKMKREIREGLRGDESNRIVIELAVPEKGGEEWEVVEDAEENHPG